MYRPHRVLTYYRHFIVYMNSMWFLCFLRKYTIHRASVEYRCEDYKLCPLFNRSQKKTLLMYIKNL